VIKAVFFIAVASLLTLSGCGKSYDGPPIMAQDMLGCRHPETYHHILEMVADKAKGNGIRLINAAFATGECRTLKAGLVIIPEQNITIDGVVFEKVRPKGQITEYWTLATALKM